MKLKDLDKIEFKNSPTVVVYRKSKRSKKHYMLVTPKSIDVINNDRARKPLIDSKYDILDLGIGHVFIGRWSKKYKIKSINFVE